MSDPMDAWSALVERAIEHLRLHHDLVVNDDGTVWLAGGVTPQTAGTDVDLRGLLTAVLGDLGPDWALVPVEPTAEMVRAAAVSRADDDEGRWPPLFDLLNCSGEDKSRRIVRQALRDGIAARPQPGGAS